MKISASLPDEDVAFLDDYAVTQRSSRSAALLEAVHLLRRQSLSADYEAAFAEFVDSGDAALWDASSTDGLPA